MDDDAAGHAARPLEELCARELAGAESATEAAWVTAAVGGATAALPSVSHASEQANPAPSTNPSPAAIAHDDWIGPLESGSP